MNYEKLWKALHEKLMFEASEGTSKLVHKGTVLQILFVMNGLESTEKTLSEDH